MDTKSTFSLGWFFILLFAVIPSILLFSSTSLTGSFSSPQIAINTLGKLFALTGMVLFCLNFLLNTRLQILENLFNGLNKVYIAHHILGSFAFIFLLIHPLLLSVQFIEVSFKDAAAFLLPFTNEGTAVLMGKLALYSLTFFLILTFYAKLPYHIWRFTHQFLGLSLFAASLHVFLIPSDVASNPILRFYILFWAAIALLSYLYKTVFYGFTFKRLSFKVQQIDWLNDKVVHLILAPKKEKMNFKPGQFVFVSIQDKEVGSEAHPFSITSSPDSSLLSVTIKNSGDYTSKLDHLKKDTLVYVEGPYGRFISQNYPQKDQIWIAGGIGITPFVGMALSLKSLQKNITLYYSVKNLSEFVHLNTLLSVSKKFANFKLVPWDTEKLGFLSADAIAQKEDVQGKEIFLCGPPPMMATLKQQFKKYNVNEKNIHSEEFALQ